MIGILVSIFKDYSPPELLAIGIMFLFAFFLTLELYSLTTGKNPRILPGILAGSLTGILFVIFLIKDLQILPALIMASYTGIYGWMGYFYLIGIGSLLLVMILNMRNSWKEEGGIEIFK